MSRQRRWQLKRIALGGCQQCGKLREQDDAVLCDSCGTKSLTSSRRRGGYKGSTRGRKAKYPTGGQ